MKPWRIYISGPITGTEDYKERFAKAKQYWEADGHNVVNPAELDGVISKDMTREDIMPVCLALLDKCDAILMLAGWEESLGANRELGYALGQEKIILYDEDKVRTYYAI